MERVILLLMFGLLGLVKANCFGKDARFDKTVPPVISQPSKTDPTTVLVNWEKQVQRPKCVDRYYVKVWADGTDMTKGKTFTVNQTIAGSSVIVQSLTVPVMPCTSYRFLVELEENDSVSGKNLQKTAEQTYRTTAKPTISTYLSKLDPKSRPKVTYWWDPVKQVVDLTKVSITFPTSTVNFPSCLDYIQVTGSEKKSMTGPPLTHKPTYSRGQSLSFGHLSTKEVYNPSITVGAASTLPARLPYSDVTRGSHTSRQSSTSSMSSSSSIDSPLPIREPHFAYTLPRPRGGASAKIGPMKISPPYLHGMPEIQVPVEGCNQYEFELKLFYDGKVLDSITGVVLPPLADIPGYVPAPVTSVMTISYDPRGKAIYAVKKDSGVTAACLPAYFEAYDSYLQRLENEVGWQVGRAGKYVRLISSTKDELDESQQELFKNLGCLCTSPNLEFVSTDPKVLKQSEKEQMGHFHFKGMHENTPYFVKSSNLNTLITNKTKQPATPEKELVLYYNTSKKQWLIAESVGSTKHLFFGSKTTTSKCPGDKGVTWQAATGTFGRWKDSPLTSVKCEKNL